MNIKHRQDIIFELLLLEPELRDNDNKLLSALWEEEFDIMCWDIDFFSAEEFLEVLANGDLSKPEAVTRCRRKLQEQNPEIRGKKYIERHQHQTEVVKQINNF